MSKQLIKVALIAALAMLAACVTGCSDRGGIEDGEPVEIGSITYWVSPYWEHEEKSPDGWEYDFEKVSIKSDTYNVSDHEVVFVTGRIIEATGEGDGVFDISYKHFVPMNPKTLSDQYGTDRVENENWDDYTSEKIGVVSYDGVSFDIYETHLMEGDDSLYHRVLCIQNADEDSFLEIRGVSTHPKGFEGFDAIVNSLE